MSQPITAERLWSIKIVEYHSVSVWHHRAVNITGAFTQVAGHPNTAALIERATHIEITLEPTGMIQPP